MNLHHARTAKGSTTGRSGTRQQTCNQGTGHAATQPHSIASRHVPLMPPCPRPAYLLLHLQMQQLRLHSPAALRSDWLPLALQLSIGAAQHSLLPPLLVLSPAVDQQ